MPLTSNILKGNDRLDQAANGGRPIRELPQVDDPEAVKRIQKALVALGFRTFFTSKTFPQGFDGDPDGRYGQETVEAVKAFQRANFPNDPSQHDGRVGRVTLPKMDEQLPKGRDPDRPRRDIPSQPASGNFRFVPLRGEIRIKFGPDNRNAQDLEDRTDRRVAIVDANTLAHGSPRATPVNQAEGNLKLFLRPGGVQAQELADFLFQNRIRAFVREFGQGNFWSDQVRGDKSFTKNHSGLSEAIRAALQDEADLNRPGSEKIVDVNILEEGRTQPAPLRSFATNISFSHKKDPARLAGDPLAFGIGDIQGIEVLITRFSGRQDGKFNGLLRYILIDHFGSNDSDKVDPGQAGLWLLQRGECSGQDTQRYKPYVIKIIADDIPFSGQLK